MGNFEMKKRYSKLAGDTCCLSCGGALEKSGASSGEICVDLGSGRGTDVIRLSEIVGDEGYVFGVDATPAMVSKGRSAAKKLGIENVEFVLSGLEEVPLKSGFADLIISNCVINHTGRKDEVWNEIYRILKNGGRFVISDIYSEEPVPAEYSSDPVSVAECWAGAVTRDEYLLTIEMAGFRQVEILEESKPYEKGKIRVCSFTITGFK